jgi:hypothetical protein
MFNPSRDEVRRFFIESWKKFQEQQELSGLEKLTIEIILKHPEYHPALSEKELERDYFPEEGVTNPFLHMSLHLALTEQISIDQPPGIHSLYDKLCSKFKSEHDALHEMIECLSETIWHAQRYQTALDQNLYLECLKKKGEL